MLPHVMRQGTADEPNKSLQARAMAMESSGALCASLFVGFPHADIHNAGLSVVITTDNDMALAERYRDELLDAAWNAREAFVYQLEPLAKSVARAKAMTEGPVFLLDHYDNAASGGPMDTTRVLAEILRQELDNVAAFGIFDPAAVKQAAAAGVGAQLTLSIGGRMKMPMCPEPSEPITVTGKVKTLFDGKYRAKGPMSAGTMQDMGHAAVIDTGRVEIVLFSRHVEPFDVNTLLSVGIDPMQKRYVMLKSRIHWRAGMSHIAKAVVECAGVGVCTSDYGQHDFKKVRRPIFPLDILHQFGGDMSDVMVVSPDVGGVARARELATRIGAPLAIVDKRREQAGEVAGMTVIGDVAGHKCIIVDDICDTAGTLCKAADVLMEAGATEVHAYTTHGVLSGPAIERLSGSVLKSLVTTDTIEATAATKACSRVRVVPTAPMFAQAIVNIWNGTSVSSLFDTASLVPIYEGLYPKGMWGR